MRRLPPSLQITLAGVLCSLSLAQAKPARKEADSQPAVEPKPALHKTLPSTLWHIWSDPQKNTIKAELLYLDGNYVGVQTEQGQFYRLNLTKLVPADREFAQKASQLLLGPKVPTEEAAAKIDAILDAALKKKGLQKNPALEEDQFVRRLYLDVAGRIPTAQELVAFLADNTPNKRTKLIDTLLASEGCHSQQFNWLADMLRVKDDFGKGVKSYVYEEWLKEQIAANRHWDALVYEMMTAEGRLTSTGPVGYLLRDRGMPLDNLSNTLTTFLGANLACAQCHDHPMADWTQRNFYEMAAFFGATEQGFSKQDLAATIRSLGLDKNKIPPKNILSSLLARVDTLPENKLTFPKDYKYPDAKPGDPVRPKLISWTKADENNPSFTKLGKGNPTQWRDDFAVWLTHPDNPRFGAAIANRVWKRFFGIAVQEPVSDLDNLEQASNPELLKHLASEMKRLHFDLREFQRVLLHTAAYQAQANSAPKAEDGPYLFSGPLLRRMSAEQIWDSVLTLVVGPDLDRYKLKRGDEMRRIDIPLDEAPASVVKSKLEAMGANKGNAKKAARLNAGKEPTFEGGTPPNFEGLTLARASELPQPSRESHFLRNFGQSDRDIADTNSTEGGVPQILMLMNGEIQKFISSPNSLLMKQASIRQTPSEQIKMLYQSFLGRSPSSSEQEVTATMYQNGLTSKDLSWVLLNTREFIFIQ